MQAVGLNRAPRVTGGTAGPAAANEETGLRRWRVILLLPEWAREMVIKVM